MLQCPKAQILIAGRLQGRPALLLLEFLHPHLGTSPLWSDVSYLDATVWHLVSETGELEEPEFSITQIKLIKNKQKNQIMN